MFYSVPSYTHGRVLGPAYGKQWEEEDFFILHLENKVEMLRIKWNILVAGIRQHKSEEDIFCSLFFENKVDILRLKSNFWDFIELLVHTVRLLLQNAFCRETGETESVLVTVWK